MVFRLSLVEEKSGNKLVYQSLKLSDQVISSAQQQLNFTQSVVLANDVHAMEFSYLGWRSLSDKAARRASGVATKLPGLDQELTPSEITFLKLERVQCDY